MNGLKIAEGLDEVLAWVKGEASLLTFSPGQPARYTKFTNGEIAVVPEGANSEIAARRIILAHLHRAMREPKNRSLLSSAALALDMDIGTFYEAQERMAEAVSNGRRNKAMVN